MNRKINQKTAANSNFNNFKSTLMGIQRSSQSKEHPL